MWLFYCTLHLYFVKNLSQFSLSRVFFAKSKNSGQLQFIIFLNQKTPQSIIYRTFKQKKSVDFTHSLFFVIDRWPFFCRGD
jgi:hypothetical protein